MIMVIIADFLLFLIKAFTNIHSKRVKEATTAVDRTISRNDIAFIPGEKRERIGNRVNRKK